MNTIRLLEFWDEYKWFILFGGACGIIIWLFFGLYQIFIIGVLVGIYYFMKNPREAFGGG